MIVFLVVMILPLIFYLVDNTSPHQESIEVRSLSIIHHDAETTVTNSQQVKQSEHTDAKAPHPPSFSSPKRQMDFHSIHVYHGPENVIDSLPNTNSNALIYNQQYLKRRQSSGSRQDCGHLGLAFWLVFTLSTWRPTIPIN